MQEPLAVDFTSQLSEQAFRLAGKRFSRWARSMSFPAFLVSAAPVGHFITATPAVRNPTGSTSEFSSCVAVTGEAIPTLSQLGLIVMAQILAVAGTRVLGRRSLSAKN